MWGTVCRVLADFFAIPESSTTAKPSNPSRALGRFTDAEIKANMGAMNGLKGFGPCSRENCTYRMERCSWGFCRACCVKFHINRMAHDSDADVAPPGPGYRFSPPPARTATVPSVFQRANLPIVAAPAGPAPEPTPGTLTPIAVTDWPADADGTLYGAAKDVGEMVLNHPLFKESKA